MTRIQHRPTLRAMAARPTLKDLAQATGVSISTISRVLNGNPEHQRIPAATIQRIRSTAESLGWRRHDAEAAHSPPAVVLVDGPQLELGWWWWGDLVGLLYPSLRSQGRNLLVATANRDGLLPGEMPNAYAALLLLPGSHLFAAELAARHPHTTTVWLDRRDADTVDHTFDLRVETMAAARLALEPLRSSGERVVRLVAAEHDPAALMQVAHHLGITLHLVRDPQQLPAEADQFPILFCGARSIVPWGAWLIRQPRDQQVIVLGDGPEVRHPPVPLTVIAPDGNELRQAIVSGLAGGSGCHRLTPIRLRRDASGLGPDPPT